MEQDGIGHLEATLRQHGLAAGLAYLNQRVPHRFTSVYRLDGNFLCSLALVDKAQAPGMEFLNRVEFGDSFCQFVLRDGHFVTTSSSVDARLDGHPYKGVMGSYVGLPLSVVPGELFGTFCHFDLDDRAISDEEFSFLQRVARVLPGYLPRAG